MLHSQTVVNFHCDHQPYLFCSERNKTSRVQFLSRQKSLTVLHTQLICTPNYNVENWFISIYHTRIHINDDRSNSNINIDNRKINFVYEQQKCSKKKERKKHETKLSFSCISERFTRWPHFGKIIILKIGMRQQIERNARPRQTHFHVVDVVKVCVCRLSSLEFLKY